MEPGGGGHGGAGWRVHGWASDVILGFPFLAKFARFAEALWIAYRRRDSLRGKKRVRMDVYFGLNPGHGTTTGPGAFPKVAEMDAGGSRPLLRTGRLLGGENTI